MKQRSIPILFVLIVLSAMFCVHPRLTSAQTNARSEFGGSGAPTGACFVSGASYSQIYVDYTTGKRWACVGAPGTSSGTWAEATAAAGGVTGGGTDGKPAAFNSASSVTNATATAISNVVFCADAGSTDTYACNLSPAMASYVVGTHVRFSANTANTGAATINFNSLGALTIVKVAGGITTALADNDIRAGQWVDCVIAAGSRCQIQSTLGNAPSAGITNSAGANVVPKSDGTNLVASQISDDGTDVLITTPFQQTKIGDPAGAGNATLLNVDDDDGSVIITGQLKLINGPINPSTAGGMAVGSVATPFGSFIVGNANNNSSQITGTFTGNRVATLPDATGIVGILLSNSATLDFANLAAIGCEDLTIAVTGAAANDTVSLSVPNGSVVANSNYTAWVSGADTVTVRFCALISGNPASGSFKVDVWKH